MRPNLAQLEQRDGADILHDLALGFLPESQLLGRIGLDAGSSISASATEQCEKFVTPAGVPTIAREWKNSDR